MFSGKITSLEVDKIRNVMFFGNKRLNIVKKYKIFVINLCFKLFPCFCGHLCISTLHMHMCSRICCVSVLCI